MLSSLDSVISTNESTEFITGHVAYTYKFQLKTNHKSMDQIGTYLADLQTPWLTILLVMLSEFHELNPQPPGCVISTPFSFHFPVHLHFNLVSSLLAILPTRLATEMIRQMIEFDQFSFHSPVPQKRLKPLNLGNTSYQNSLK